VDDVIQATYMYIKLEVTRSCITCQAKMIFDHLNFDAQDWIAKTSIKFKSQLNLKCKLISCTFQVNLSVN